MTRVQFLNDLYRRISSLPEEQAEQHLTYYAEMLADRIEEGMSEEEAVASMEPLDTIVQRIFEDSPVQPPVYPDLPKTDGSRFTKVPKVPKGRKSLARIALWAIAIVLALGAAGNKLREFSRSSKAETITCEAESAEASEYSVDYGIAQEELEELEPLLGFSISPNGIDVNNVHIGPDGIFHYESSTEVYGTGTDYSFDGNGINTRYDITGDICLPSDPQPYEINVNWENGAVQICPWDGDTVVFRELSGSPLSEAQKLEYDENGGVLDIYEGMPLDKGLLLMVPSYALSYLTVYTTTADVLWNGIYVEEARIETATGDVTIVNTAANTLSVIGESGNTVLQGVGAAELDIEQNSGDIILNGTAAEMLEASAISGNITGFLSGGEVKLETTSGNINIREEAYQLGVDTCSGNVRTEVCGANGNYVDVETITGKVDLLLPPDFTLEFNTGSGHLNTNSLDLVRSDGQYRYGSGGPLYIEVETSSGNLNLRTA